MNPQRALILSAVLATPLLLGVTACGKNPLSVYSPNMTTLSARLEPVFAKTKTVCFGRFVMEVPITAELVYGPADALVGVERYPNQAEKLDEFVRKAQARTREDDLGYKDEEKFFRSNDSYWGKTQDGVVRGQKTVFGVDQGSKYRIDSLHEQSMQRLNMIARTLQQRPKDNVPHEPGICIDGGFVPGLDAADFEKVTLGVRLKEIPDAHFSIETRKIDHAISPNDHMAKRQQEAEQDAHTRPWRLVCPHQILQAQPARDQRHQRL